MHKNNTQRIVDFCSFHPYFEIPNDRLAQFISLMPSFEAKTKAEKGCLYYNFSVSEGKTSSRIHCREAYTDADAILYHLDNVAELLTKGLQDAELIRVEVHGVEADINKLREPLKDLHPDFYTIW
ncbi:hypothetical protein ACH42_04270 [Endozoicomonas sp. (ex Bugula neritina AB1)]|nr:hypothetical protein ACH42_04270 [Endozoicomonas sp. (ex Bugula neritina AB1)]